MKSQALNSGRSVGSWAVQIVRALTYVLCCTCLLFGALQIHPTYENWLFDDAGPILFAIGAVGCTLLASIDLIPRCVHDTTIAATPRRRYGALIFFILSTSLWLIGTLVYGPAPQTEVVDNGAARLVRTSMVLADTIYGFDRARFKTMLTKHLKGVQDSDIVLEVSAASVRVGLQIR
eukprot:1088859-Prymnesium_polylepis.1